MITLPPRAAELLHRTGEAPRTELPDALLASNALSPEEALAEARLAVATKWFEKGRLAAGRAAELAELSRAEFMFAISGLGKPAGDIADPGGRGRLRSGAG